MNLNKAIKKVFTLFVRLSVELSLMGKEKVSAETALMYLSYNIRRAIAIAGGVSKLIRLFLPQLKLHQGIPMPRTAKSTAIQLI